MHERILIWLVWFVSASTTLILGFLDRPAAATVCGAFAIALLVFLFLPQMESFEVFGLKAKLRERVVELDALISLVRTSAKSSSRIIFHQLAHMGRWTHTPWKQKAEFVREVEASLSPNAVSKSELDELKEPLLKFIVVDILHALNSVVAERAERYVKLIQKQINTEFPNSLVTDASRHKYLVDLSRSFNSSRSLIGDSLETGEIRNPKALIEKVLSNSQLPSSDIEKLKPITDRCAAMTASVWKTHSLTPEAVAFADQYTLSEGPKRLYSEIFADDNVRLTIEGPSQGETKTLE